MAYNVFKSMCLVKKFMASRRDGGRESAYGCTNRAAPHVEFRFPRFLVATSWTRTWEITFLALDRFAPILTASEKEGERSGLMLCFVMWLGGIGSGVQHLRQPNICSGVNG